MINWPNSWLRPLGPLKLREKLQKNETITLLGQVHGNVSGSAIKSRITRLINALRFEADTGVTATDEFDEDSSEVENPPLITK